VACGRAEGVVPPATAGIVTQGSGDIQMYSKGSILLGLSRIMTTFGGDILAWSAEGDINAGRGAKTTVLYTPARRVYDSYGNVALSPVAPSSGAGIATLNPIPRRRYRSDRTFRNHRCRRSRHSLLRQR